MFSEFFASLAAGPANEFWWAVGLSAALSAVTLVWGFRTLGRARLMQDLPTSRIGSASQGYVEIEGHVRHLPGPSIVSPLTATRCVWWHYSVEQQQRGRRNKRSWKTLVRDTSDELFLLADPTGECIVDPHGAKVIPSLKRRWQGRTRRPGTPPARSPFFSFGEYRYTEHLVSVGDPIYALGLFRTQHGVQSFSEADDVRDLLAEWKRDQQSLLARFDTNQDGVIDLQEWEAVRRAALETVRQRHVEQAVRPDLNILSRPQDRRLFLISTTPEEVLVGVKRRKAGALIAVGIVSFAFAAAALEARLSPSPAVLGAVDPIVTSPVGAPASSGFNPG